MVEVNGIDAQGPARRIDDRLQRSALQIELVEGPVARQEQVAAGADRIARQHHVAELETSLAKATFDELVIDQDVAGRTKGCEIVGKERGKGLDQIGIAIPAIATGALLQRDHIGVAHAFGDARRVKTPILPDAILDVVAYELHDTL